MNKYSYRIYGISVISEFEIPDLQICETGKWDVYVSYGSVPNRLPRIKQQGLLYQAAPSDFIFKLDQVGKFRAQDGSKIIIDPNKNATSSEISLFLLGSVMGAILHQRGLLALHGSSIIYNSQALVIIGKSASGKSSLAAGLWAKGYKPLSDDISVVSNADNENFLVQPGVPYFKLWKDVIEYLKIDQNLQKVRPQIEKYIVPIPHFKETNPTCLKHIILLVSTNKKGYRIEEISGTDKFDILLNNIYRTHFLYGLDKISDQFRNISNLANTIKLYRIERPLKPLCIKELANFIETNLINV